MQLWKLGCRWRGGTPLFYDFIKDESIVIGWIDKDYAVGDWLLITDGYTVLSIAEILQKRESVLEFPQYESIFDELKIPYNENLFIYRAKHIQLKTGDQFTYPLQQGIVKVHKPEYIAKFNHLKQKYMIPNKDIIEILINKKQIILQGAPGTGKTYIAKDIAEQLIFNNVSDDKKLQAERLKISEQFKLVQFHPSYTYEDFVRGIEVKTESGQPVYVTCNRVLGEIAKKAYDNWLDSKKDSPTLAREKTFELQLEEFKKKVEEKIATESAFRVKGTTAIVTEITDSSFRFTYEHDRSVNYTLLFTDLIKLDNSGIVFKQVKDVDEFDLIMKRKASYYFRIFNEIKSIDVEPKEPDIKVSLKNFVLIIDEINRANLPVVLGELIYALEYRGENVESMYGVEENKGLIVPPNLYIIGTMNTADRSVGQIDYAIRRRFAFVDTLPKPLTNISGFDIELFKKVSAFFIKNVDDYIDNPDDTELERSEYLLDEFSPEDVWIGHSFFIMDADNRELRLNYEIKPLLREYLKDGILKDSVEGQKTKVLINSL